MDNNAGNNRYLPAGLIPVSADGIKKYLSVSDQKFYDIICSDMTDSTNLRAKEFAQRGCAEGVTVVATEQTAGRGRLGRKFYSPRGSGIYFSVVLRPSGMLKPDFITTAAAVAVCRAIETLTDAKTEIKWVNDVLVGGKKVCGILTEGAISASGTLDRAVLGIGINLLEPDCGFPPELDGTAGAVYTDGAPYVDIADRMTAGVFSEFSKLYSSVKKSVTANLIREYAALCTTPGKRVTVLRGTDRRGAIALRLDESLHLTVRYDDGTEEALTSGEVSVRPLDGV